MRRSRAPAVIGLLLVAGAAVVFAVGGGESRPRPRVVGGDLPLNDSGTDTASTEAHNSPAVVANPTDPANLVVASRVDNPQLSCALHVTFDGGATWARHDVPAVEEADVGCFAPDAAFGPEGTLYVSFTSFAPVEGQGTVPAALWVATSGDGGRTLQGLVRATGPTPFQARLAADPTVAGRVYVTWVDAGATTAWGFADPGNPILLARSDDGGATWAPPVTVTGDRGRVVAPVIAVGPASEVYVAFLDVGDDRLDYDGAHEGRGGPPDAGPWSVVVARSDDGGQTWRETTVDDAVVPVMRFLVLFPPAPALAVDSGGSRIYVAFHDGRAGDADVAVWASGDGGATWSEPRLLDGAGEGRWQYLPALSVAPGGRLDAVYYDRRADPDNRLNEVSLQSSFDGGRSFGERLRLSSRGFDSAIGFGRDRGLPELGHRLGAVSTRSGLLAVWADTRAGSELTGRQDLGKAVVRFEEPEGFPGGPVLAGALGLTGLGLLVLAALGRRRPPAVGD